MSKSYIQPAKLKINTDNMNNQIVIKQIMDIIRPYEGDPTDLIRFTNEFSEIYTQYCNPESSNAPFN